MQFTVNRATWRCGGDGPYKHGNDATLLRDNAGMMCCLGHVSCQLGAQPEQILGKFTPQGMSGLECLAPTLIETDLVFGFSNTDFTKTAMSINDNEQLTRPNREAALVEHFTEHGHELTFTGEYAA